MELVYFRLSETNFGDEMNTWLWDDILPGWRDAAPEVHLMGVGTILNRSMTPEGRKLVLGSGAGYGALPDVSDGSWDIRAVRGPLTAEALGLPAERAVADPAVLLPPLPRFADIVHEGGTIFVPHHDSAHTCDWETVCSRLGIGFVSPTGDAEAVIRRIAGAERVIAESMHAAIIADAFGVPWQGVSLSASFNGRKWLDWSRSLGLEDPQVRPFYRALRAAQRLRARLTGRRPAAPARRPAGAPQPMHDRVVTVARQRKPWLEPFAARDLRRSLSNRFQLTDRARLAAAQDRLTEILDQARRDYVAERARA